jgi:hypothetical protein
MGLAFDDADMGKPRLDESKASEYIGKTVLMGLTYLDHNDKLIEQRQCVGTIMTFSNEKGIRIKLQDLDDPFDLPPDPRGIRGGQTGNLSTSINRPGSRQSGLSRDLDHY